jgi:hypothetical protein
LTLNVPPDDPNLPEYLGVLRHLLTREFQPIRRIAIESINDDDAARSPYLDTLRTVFDVMVDYKEVVLYRRLGRTDGRELMVYQLRRRNGAACVTSPQPSGASL